MLRHIRFSQSVSAVPDKVDEYQPAAKGIREHTATRRVQLRRRTQGHARRGKSYGIRVNGSVAVHTGA
jgi:hypothetical protein